MPTFEERQPKPQDQKKHPPPWDADLESDRLAGQNVGLTEPDEGAGLRPAADDKELTRALQDFTMDELREIFVLAPGSRLRQDASYVDLRGAGRKPFVATGNMVVGDDQWIVPKAAVPFMYWNRLIEVPEAERRAT
jgi:hypothetical protein